MVANNSRIGTFQFNGREVRLQASLRNLRRLGERVGGSGLMYLVDETELPTIEDALIRITNIIWALQVEDEFKSADDVEAWLFGNWATFFNNTDQLALLRDLFKYVLGDDVATQLQTASEELPKSPKKTASSRKNKSPLET